MDLKSIQLEGVTRSTNNLKKYEDYNKTKISGQKRLLHVSMKGKNNEIRYFFTYAIKMINRTTINFQCHDNQTHSGIFAP